MGTVWFHSVTPQTLFYLERRFHHAAQSCSPPASNSQEAGVAEVGCPVQLENFNELFIIH